MWLRCGENQSWWQTWQSFWTKTQRTNSHGERERSRSTLSGFALPAELYSARFSWQKFWSNYLERRGCVAAPTMKHCRTSLLKISLCGPRARARSHTSQKAAQKTLSASHGIWSSLWLRMKKCWPRLLWCLFSCVQAWAINSSKPIFICWAALWCI